QHTFGRLVGPQAGFEVVASPAADAVHHNTIEAHIVEGDRDTPIGFHGAGLWEALILSVLLDDSAGQVVLLDEPAANLHPSVQRRLVRLLHEKAEQRHLGQIFVVSHSPYVLPTTAHDFEHVYRFSKKGDETISHRLDEVTRRHLYIK